MPPPGRGGWRCPPKIICQKKSILINAPLPPTTKFIYSHKEILIMLKKRLNLPSIRKTVSSFLLEEEGKISKQSLLKVGAAIGSISAMAGIASAAHSQNIAHSQAVSLGYSANTITATHSHYDPAHSSHSSHSSHASHSSGGCGICAMNF